MEPQRSKSKAPKAGDLAMMKAEVINEICAQVSQTDQPQNTKELQRRAAALQHKAVAKQVDRLWRAVRSDENDDTLRFGDFVDLHVAMQKFLVSPFSFDAAYEASREDWGVFTVADTDVPLEARIMRKKDFRAWVQHILDFWVDSGTVRMYTKLLGYIVSSVVHTASTSNATPEVRVLNFVQHMSASFTEKELAGIVRWTSFFSAAVRQKLLTVKWAGLSAKLRPVQAPLQALEEDGLRGWKQVREAVALNLKGSAVGYEEAIQHAIMEGQEAVEAIAMAELTASILRKQDANPDADHTEDVQLPPSVAMYLEELGALEGLKEQMERARDIVKLRAQRKVAEEEAARKAAAAQQQQLQQQEEEYHAPDMDWMQWYEELDEDDTDDDEKYDEEARERYRAREMEKARLEAEAKKASAVEAVEFDIEPALGKHEEEPEYEEEESDADEGEEEAVDMEGSKAEGDIAVAVPSKTARGDISVAPPNDAVSASSKPGMNHDTEYNAPFRPRVMMMTPPAGAATPMGAAKFGLESKNDTDAGSPKLAKEWLSLEDEDKNQLGKWKGSTFEDGGIPQIVQEAHSGDEERTDIGHNDKHRTEAEETVTAEKGDTGEEVTETEDGEEEYKDKTESEPDTEPEPEEDREEGKEAVDEVEQVKRQRKQREQSENEARLDEDIVVDEKGISGELAKDAPEYDERKPVVKQSFRAVSARRERAPASKQPRAKYVFKKDRKKKNVQPQQQNLTDGVRMLLSESSKNLEAAKGARRLTDQALTLKCSVKGRKVLGRRKKKNYEKTFFLNPLPLGHLHSQGSKAATMPPPSGRHVEQYRVVRAGFGLQPLGSSVRSPTAIPSAPNVSIFHVEPKTKTSAPLCAPQSGTNKRNTWALLKSLN